MRGHEIILPLKLISIEYFVKENKITKKLNIFKHKV